MSFCSRGFGFFLDGRTKELWERFSKAHPSEHYALLFKEYTFPKISDPEQQLYGEVILINKAQVKRCFEQNKDLFTKYFSFPDFSAETIVTQILDFLRNYICLLKLPFLASLSLNFSAICPHMPSKFTNKSAQKISIFSSKANYARSLLESRNHELIGIILGFGPYNSKYFQRDYDLRAYYKNAQYFPGQLYLNEEDLGFLKGHLDELSINLIDLSPQEVALEVQERAVADYEILDSMSQNPLSPIQLPYFGAEKQHPETIALIETYQAEQKK